MKAIIAECHVCCCIQMSNQPLNSKQGVICTNMAMMVLSKLIWSSISRVRCIFIKVFTSLMAVWAMLGLVNVTNEMLQGKMQLSHTNYRNLLSITTTAK